MEIGPISAIRPITMVKPLRGDVDLSGVFAIEFRKQADDATYSSSQRRIARGLEDEASDEDDLLDEVGEAESKTAVDSTFAPTNALNKISFFA
jgi:hypothetical protein